MEQLCEDQIKCKEDTAETWTCCAHLHAGNAFRCPYVPSDIIYVKLHDREVPVKDNGYPCIDYRPFKSKDESMKVEESKIPSLSSPPRCRHGKAGRNCPECRDEDAKIKKLTNPLVDEWWEKKSTASAMYHMVFRAYHMGMKEEHLK